jgi:sulfane dehydrogenase subunit SoxC
MPADPTKVQGPPASDLGSRSPFEKPKRVSLSDRRTSSLTPLQDLDGIITPSDLHFERHHGGVPAIDPAQYSLLIHGMVDRPMVFTLPDLRRFPGTSMIRMMECSGNGGRVYRREGNLTDLTPQQIDGLTSTSEWTGVPLKTLLRETGASAKATWFLAEGMDAAVMTRSIPMEKAWDDALIAYGQNGEPLRPEQGIGAVVLPGVEQRQHQVAAPHRARRPAVHDTGNLEVPTRCQPHVQPRHGLQVAHHRAGLPDKLTGPGWWEIRGIAWTGRGGSPASGHERRWQTWQNAQLDEPVLPKSATRFRLLQVEGGDTIIASRATDDTGYEPTYDAARGARSLDGVSLCLFVPGASPTGSSSWRRPVTTNVRSRADGGPAIAFAQKPLGRAATPDEIRLDIDVMPDGRGLPAGSGTVAEGAKIYAEKCASCHGKTGEGASFERLVATDAGKNFDFATNAKLPRAVGNYWPYATTLYDYTYRAMPFMQPGTLSANETYSLVAYILALNSFPTTQ